MTDIKITKIEFGAQPFRKLKNLTVPIAERVTLIAGHNGLGKSTLMAFLANNCALTSKVVPHTFLGTRFKANIDEIIHIDHLEIVNEAGVRHPHIGDPRIHHIVNGQPFVKRCNLSVRNEYSRARVVPRNDPTKKFQSGNIQIGPAQKIPLPTIYLGMRRVLPVGEMNQRRVVNKPNTSMSLIDEQFISDFVRNVIETGTNKSGITTLEIKNTQKYTQHPAYAYDSRAISLGQDSLTAIANAFASFAMLKRVNQNDYYGGLLLIDEVDVGFHPHAIGKLATAIKKHAKKLNLQVVATTHSPRMIEAFHPDADGSAYSTDSVVYLHDSTQPQLASDQSLKAILDDMNLVAPNPTVLPTVKVYFEDLEAHEWFIGQLPSAEKIKIAKKHSVQLVPFDLALGCKSLEKLPDKDPYFQTVVIAVDADAALPTGKRNHGNFVKLPGGQLNNKGLSPERSLHAFLTEWTLDPTSYSDAKLATKFQGFTSDFIKAHFLDHGHNMEDRDSAKKWWRERSDKIKQYHLIQAWAVKHQPELVQFILDLDVATATVAQRVRKGWPN